MNHKSVKPVVLCIAALVALFVLFSVSAGASAFASRGAIAETGTPCCQRHAPSQVAFQSTRGSGGVYAATTALSRGSTPAQFT